MGSYVDKNGSKIQHEPFLEPTSLELGGGTHSQADPSPTGSATYNVGSHFELKPSYKFLEAGPFALKGAATLFAERLESDSQLGARLGPQLDFSLPELRTAVFVGADINPIVLQSGFYFGVKIHDLISLSGTRIFQSGPDTSVVSVGVDIFGIFRAREKKKQEEIHRREYASFFERQPDWGSMPEEKQRRDAFSKTIEGRRQNFLNDLRQMTAHGSRFNPPNAIAFQKPETTSLDDYKTTAGVSILQSLKSAFDDSFGLNMRDAHLDENSHLSFLSALDSGNMSPDSVIRKLSAGELEVDSRLKEPDTFRLPMATLHLDIQKDFFKITLWDWFEEKPFFEKYYPQNETDPRFWIGLTDEIRSVVTAYRDNFDVEEALEKLAPLTPQEKGALSEKQVYRVKNPEGWSDEEVRDAKKSYRYLDSHFAMTLQANPAGAEEDREESRSPFIYSSLELFVNASRLKKADFGPIEITGHLNYFSLILKNPKKMVPLAKQFGLKPGTDYKYRDRYGNLVGPLGGPKFKTGKTAFVGFAVHFPYHFAEERRDAAKNPLKTIGLDLSRYGFQDHPRLFTTLSLYPEKTPTENNPYFLYSSLSPEDRSKAEGLYEKLMKRTADVEENFGLKPGEGIKGFYLVPSSDKNASVRWTNPDIFFIWDEIIPDVNDGKAYFVVPHEIYHCLDAKFGFGEYPAFKKFFETLKNGGDTELFTSVNETDFLDVEYGGHASDNVEEFFASLMNTLKAPQWEQKVQEMRGDIRGKYYYALLQLREALISRHPPLSKSPIIQILDGRIAALEKMETFKNLESYTLIRVSEMLPEAPNSIPVIKSWDFKKEVVQQEKPVFVYVFQEGHQEYALKAKELFGKYLTKYKMVAISFDDASHFTRDNFNDHLGGGELYLFYEGKAVGYVDISDLTSPYRWLKGRAQEQLENILNWLKEID